MATERWELQRCAGCGRVSMGRAPEEFCPTTDRMETQAAFVVVPLSELEDLQAQVLAVLPRREA
jgi:hypothetical protein